LIIDDEASVVELIKIILEEENYHIITAFDGDEGLAKIESERPDLIILDIVMPRVDGYSVLIAMKEFMKIKDRFPSMIPVIVLTACVDSKVEKLIRNEGIAGYLEKPVKIEELLNSIRVALKEA